MLTRLLIATASALASSGCTVTVVPPRDVVRPVDVFIVDYGRHSSLLLPGADGEELIEYAYGDWNWFALARDGPLDVLPTLFLPTQGALGRWAWSVEPQAERLEQAISSERIHTVTVDAASAAALRDRLETRHESSIHTRHVSTLYQLVFVHDERPYCLFHHCNHVMQRWLEELGCETSGMAIVADFRMAGE